MNRRNKKFILFCFIIFVLGIVVINADTVTVTAAATGSVNPATANASVQTNTVNGDFTITDTSGLNRLIGDGADEATNWVFNFGSDPDVNDFSIDDTLTSAMLTLTLTPGTPLNTDAVLLNGLSSVRSPVFANLVPADGTTTVQIELLDYYTSESIMQKFEEDNYAQIGAYYADDAIVSFAELELVAVVTPPTFAVPELQTFAMLAFCLAGVFAYKR